MNKPMVLIFLLWIFLLVSGYSAGFSVTNVRGGTVLTNITTLHSTEGMTYFVQYHTNTNLTVGRIYGLSELFSPYQNYVQTPNYTLRIHLAFTNKANDADEYVTLGLVSFSNNQNYTGGGWNTYFEVNGTNVGTNYTVPYQMMGEGAILNYQLVVVIPQNCPNNSMGYATVSVSTLSNSNHIAAIYQGYNANQYGGKDRVTMNFSVRVNSLNQIQSLYATDDIDRINQFDGSMGLRRSRNTITVTFSNDTVGLQNTKLWYCIDRTVDGPSGLNLSDSSLPLTRHNSKTYSVSIPESALSEGGLVSFLFEIDGILYDGNYRYLLHKLHQQREYQTVVMNNLLDQGTDSKTTLKLPEVALGSKGRIAVYSVSGDLVVVLTDGIIDKQLFSWDGTDRLGAKVTVGMYYIVIEASTVKEVRKVFVK